MRAPFLKKLSLFLGALATLASMTVGAALLSSHLRKHDVGMNEVLYFMDPSHQGVPLKRAEIFTSRRIGYGGEESRLTSLFNRVMADGDSEGALVDLSRLGAPGARLYGLCGLSLRKSGLLAAEVAVARRDERRVAVLSGCGVSIASVGEAVDSDQFWSVCRAIPRATKELPSALLEDRTSVLSADGRPQ